jgi:hypothetical protein
MLDRKVINSTKLFALLLFMCCAFIGQAQRQYGLWYFGDGATLDFREGNPQARNESEIRESVSGYNLHTSIICDSLSGDLLFYTDGYTVWDKDDQVMPNGVDLKGSGFALIVPAPGLEKIYYLFTLLYAAPFPNETCALYQHTIDMSLRNGLGDVKSVSKNELLLTNLSFKLTAVAHANGRDYWIITHESGTNKFLLSVLTQAGLAPFQTQAIGQTYLTSDPTPFSPNTGYLKASPDGRLLAESISGNVTNRLNLFSFNRSTGALYNHIPLETPGIPFGLSFSSDNTQLYVSFASIESPNRGDQINGIYQYDVSTLDKSVIDNSRIGMLANNPFTNIGNDLGAGVGGPALFSLQLAPDGRIYSGNSWLSPPFGDGYYLVVIDKPNKKGFEAMINTKYFDFKTQQIDASRLPNFIESIFNGLESRTVCSDASSISIYPNPTQGNVMLTMLPGCEQTYSLQVVNVLGQQIMSNTNLVFNQVLDISTLSSGVYFFIVSTGYNERLVRKIVKTDQNTH